MASSSSPMTVIHRTSKPEMVSRSPMKAAFVFDDQTRQDFIADRKNFCSHDLPVIQFAISHPADPASKGELFRRRPVRDSGRN